MYSAVVSDVVVVGLITCERVVLGKGAKVLIRRSAQGILTSTSWKKKLKTRRMNRTIGEKRHSKKRKGESQRVRTTTS